MKKAGFWERQRENMEKHPTRDPFYNYTAQIGGIAYNMTHTGNALVLRKWIVFEQTEVIRASSFLVKSKKFLFSEMFFFNYKVYSLK